MPKINVYVSDRLAEAVRHHEIPVSTSCQRALEQEVASRLPFLELTPRARDVLIEASSQANRLGQNYVGVEHLMLAILDEGRSMPAQVIEATGMTERIRAELHAVIARPAVASNRVADEDGNVIGYLIEERGLVSPGGKPLRMITSEGGSYAVDENGARQATVPTVAAPHLLALDASGNPVIIIDEHGRHTGRHES